MGHPSQPEATGSRWVGSLAFLSVLNIVLYWVCIPYRTQQRFMLQSLGLAAVPLAMLLDRRRGLRIGAAALLALHLLTPQTWPITLDEAKIPWDLSPLIPNAVGSPLPLFERIARAGFAPRRITSAATRLIIFLSMGCFAGLGVWAAARTTPWQTARDRGRGQSSLPALSVVGLVGDGCPRDGSPRSRRQAALLSGFPGFLRGMAEPGKPIGIRRVRGWPTPEPTSPTTCWGPA